MGVGALDGKSPGYICERLQLSSAWRTCHPTPETLLAFRVASQLNSHVALTPLVINPVQ